MLSNTCKYAIRSVIYLSLNTKENKKVGIKKISEDLKIPAPFLGKILQSLAKQNLLASSKGPHGGFGIARDPYEITLIDIIEIVDGVDMFENCLIGLHPCKSDASKTAPCPVHNQFGDIRKTFYDMFSNKTVGQLIDEMGNAEEYISL